MTASTHKTELVYVSSIRPGAVVFGRTVASVTDDGTSCTFTMTDGVCTVPMRRDHKVRAR